MAAEWKDHDSREPSWTTNLGVKPRSDPYFIWAAATDFADLGGNHLKWIPVIIELLPGKTAMQFADSISGLDWIRVPSIYRFPRPSLEETRFCTARIRKDALARLEGARKEPVDRYESLPSLIKRFELGLPIVSENDPESDTDVESRAFSVARPQTDNLPSVVVGIIDDGLAFAHERFREHDGRSTRVEYFWNQDESLTDAPGSEGVKQRQGTASESLRVGYGWELTKERIDRLLQESSRYTGLVDEDAVYRQAGYRGVRRRSVHGTHVMDIACGSDPQDRTAKPPRIICVQLPSQTTRDTSGRSLAVHVLEGLRYIVDRAYRIAGEHGRVIVNLSYGNIAGPHDGSSLLEAAIDQLIDLHGNLSVVVPAGNSYLARCHAHLSLRPGSGKTLNWRILPDDETPSFLEIWLPSTDSDGAASKVAVRVKPPWGEPSDLIHQGKSYEWRPRKDVLCTVVYADSVATGKRNMVLIAVAPTATMDQHRDVAPAGEWEISIDSCGGDMTIDAWIQRDDTPFGYPVRGRQSRFEDSEYVRFDHLGQAKEDDDEQSYVKRAWTLNAIATGKHTTVIGGFRRSDGAVAPYSASGPTIEQRAASVRTGPNAVAVSEDSPVLRGILAAGTRSGSVATMNGTSVAAPQITRQLASHTVGPAGRQTAHNLVANLPSPEHSTPADPQAPETASGRAFLAAVRRKPYKPELPVERAGVGRIDKLPSAANMNR